MRPNRITRWIATIAAALLVATSSTGRAEPPTVGSRALEFSLPSLAGPEVSLESLRSKGPVVLVVLRGYPGYQCPVCTRQVGDFLSKASAFREAGAQVVMVYPGPADELAEKAKEFTASVAIEPPFTFLLDPGYTFTNAYDLRWDAPSETAYPSTFVIDPEGIVRFAQVSKSHGGRVAAADAIKALP